MTDLEGTPSFAVIKGKWNKFQEYVSEANEENVKHMFMSALKLKIDLKR